jgi:hypothetical protein
MDERHSNVPSARASHLPPPVRRSVIPIAPDAVERRSSTPSPALQARRHFAAFGLLLAGGAALGFHASLSSDSEAPSAPVFTSHPVRRAPVARASAPVVEPVEAAAVVEPAEEAPPTARRHHRHHRSMLASSDRAPYTLIILP